MSRTLEFLGVNPMSPKKARIGTASRRKKKQISKTLQTFIVSRHTLWRQGLRRLLDNSGAGIVVVGEAAQGADAVRQVTELSPDILILDLALSKLDGLELFRPVRGIENIRKVILTPEIRKQDLARALKLGVNAVLLKGSPLDELIRCIRRIATGGTCFQQQQHDDVMSASTPSPFTVSARRPRQSQQFHITYREMEIVEAVVAGYTNKEIASRFCLSVDTVRHHVTNIFDKTGASNRLELVLFAIEKKLVDNAQLGIGVTAIEAASRVSAG